MKARKGRIALLFVAAVAFAYGRAVAGTVYVGDIFSGVGLYSSSGSAINSSLVAESSPLPGNYGIALDATGNLYVASDNGSAQGNIAKYGGDGTVINPNLISVPGLTELTGLAVAGNDLFVADNNTGTIREYTTSGATVNSNLVSGLSSLEFIADDGNGNLYAVYGGQFSSVAQFAISNGQVISSNYALIANIYSATGIALDGQGHIFVAWNGRVGEYNTDGTTVNSSLLSAINPRGLAADGNDLYVAAGSVGEYTISNGAVTSSNPSFISSTDPVSVAINPAPEPTAMGLFALLALPLIRRRQSDVG